MDAQLCDHAGGGPGDEVQLLTPLRHIGAVPTDAQAFLPVGQVGLAPVGGVVVAVAGGAVERVLPVGLAHADAVPRVMHLPPPYELFRALGVQRAKNSHPQASVVPGGDGSDQSIATLDGDQFAAEVHGPDLEPPVVTSG